LIDAGRFRFGTATCDRGPPPPFFLPSQEVVHARLCLPSFASHVTPVEQALRLDLPPTAKLVYIAILDGVGSSFLSYSDLADAVGISRRSAVYAIRLLKKKRLITAEPGKLKNVDRNSYCAKGGAKVAPGVVQSLLPPGAVSALAQRGVGGIVPVQDQNGTGTSKEKTSPKRKVPLPADWEPTAKHSEIAHEEGKNLSREAERFRDYCAANGKTYVLPHQAFNNWLRNHFGGTSKPPTTRPQKLSRTEIPR